MADRDLTILAAASENHARPLRHLLTSLERHEPGTRVILYDLGLSERARDLIQRRGHALIRFPFDEYPDHVAAHRLRTYAWKPALIHRVYHQVDGPLLYLDAGNLVHRRLDSVRAELAKSDIYTPTSRGTIADWCHPAALAAMRVEAEILQSPNRTAGIVGFGTGPLARAIVDQWYQHALRPDIICPPGATLRNHRFDQSILGVLLARAQRQHGLILCDARLDISVHNDGLDRARAKAAMELPSDAHWDRRRLKRRRGPLRGIWRMARKIWRNAKA